MFHPLITKIGGALAKPATRTAGESKDISSAIDEALNRIFDVAPDIIGARRLSDGRFRYVNSEFTKVHGWTREEALSLTFDELGLWTNPAQQAEFFCEFAAKGLVRNFEAEMQVGRNTGAEPMLMSAVRVDLNGEPHLVAVVRRLADIRRAEQRTR